MYKLIIFFIMSSSVWAGTSDFIFKGGFEESLFFVGGTSSTNNVTIKLNQFEDYQIDAPGAYIIPHAIETGNAYQVSIVSTPITHLCTVENESGVIGSTDVIDVNILCGQLTTIYDVKQENITGMVSLENMLVTHCQDNYGFWVQTIPGDSNYSGDDYSGGFVLKQDIDCDAGLGDVKIGDRITLNSANINKFFEHIQLEYQKSILLSENNSLPEPVIALPMDLIGALPVALEGVLVKIENVEVTSSNMANGSFEVDNLLTVDDRLYSTAPFPIVNYTYESITGVMWHLMGESKLIPRTQQDLVANIINTTIYDVKQENVTGLVSLENMLVTHCQDNYGFWIQTITGDTNYSGDDYSGGFVLKQDIDCSSNSEVVQVGDRINLTNAIIDKFFQHIQLHYLSSIVLSSDNLLPVPILANVADISGSSVVPLEGVLVKVENVTVTSLDIPNNSFEIDNLLTIDDRLFLVSPFPTVGFNYSSITGVMWHFFNESILIPRYSQDIFEPNGSAANLVINEVDYDQPSMDTTEFVEIFNPTSASISLINKSLYLINGGSNSDYSFYDLDDLGSILPGQYLVVGSNSALSDTADGSLLIELTGLIQNGLTDGIVLIDRSNSSVIDGMSYEGNIATAILTNLGITVNVTEGSSTLEDTGNGSLSRISNSQDTDNNDADFTFSTTLTPGAANLN